MRRLAGFGALLVLCAVAPLTGCGAPPDCASGSAADLSTIKLVSCTDPSATLRVLGHVNLVDDCLTVPGATVAYDDSGQAHNALCLGPKDADPARAVNAARVGDCLTDIQASEVSTADCTDPSAVYRVLSRKRTATDLGDLGAGCSDAPGSTANYTWSMRDTGSYRLPIGTGLYFCLIDKDLDPARSADRARPGACLAPLANHPDDYQQVDCADSSATMRVLQRFDGYPIESQCDGVPGATGTLTKQTSGPHGYTLCIGPVS